MTKCINSYHLQTLFRGNDQIKYLEPILTWSCDDILGVLNNPLAVKSARDANLNIHP